MHKILSKRLYKPSIEGHDVGFLISERLLNMPAQTAPPMYTMLLEELEWAREDNEPYNFAYYVYLSKAFRMRADAVDDKDDLMRPRKMKSVESEPEVPVSRGAA